MDGKSFAQFLLEEKSNNKTQEPTLTIVPNNSETKQRGLPAP